MIMFYLPGVACGYAGGCTAFSGIRPPEDGDYWEFAADLSRKRCREICKAFSTGEKKPIF